MIEPEGRKPIKPLHLGDDDDADEDDPGPVVDVDDEGTYVRLYAAEVARNEPVLLDFDEVAELNQWLDRWMKLSDRATWPPLPSQQPDDPNRLYIHHRDPSPSRRAGMCLNGGKNGTVAVTVHRKVSQSFISITRDEARQVRDWLNVWLNEEPLHRSKSIGDVLRWDPAVALYVGLLTGRFYDHLPEDHEPVDG